jgi:hypothetical protein
MIYDLRPLRKCGSDASSLLGTSEKLEKTVLFGDGGVAATHFAEVSIYDCGGETDVIVNHQS